MHKSKNEIMAVGGFFLMILESVVNRNCAIRIVMSSVLSRNAIKGSV